MSDTTNQRDILVVDDEPQITRVLKTTLSSQGFAVRTASDGQQALRMIGERPPDLLITDLRMPTMGGLELCRSVRKTSSMPIIVLSVKGEEEIKVEALDSGADDYVTKPFSVNELMARVRVALRRVPEPSQPESARIDIGDFFIDLQSHSVQVKDSEVHLTPKEFDLPAYLARHPGRVLTHRVLLSAVWGANSVEQPEYLRVFVGHLRKKLDALGDRHYILTEPWVGYRFDPGE
jgi:two-component system KDP operon response regulator KdpE